MSEPLIGLGGRLRSGKDVVADRLVEKHGYVKLGMSDALHEAMLALDPLIVTYEGAGGIYDWDNYSDLVAKIGYVEAKKNPYVRAYLQRLGTDVGRNLLGENVWVDMMARKIDDHRGAGHPVVVTGIRFPNELQMVAELGGWTTWINRPTAGHEFIPGHDMSITQHSSENSVREGDFMVIIQNDGSLEQLYEKADGLAMDAAVW